MKLMVIGFPKSGTTSITAALKASGFRPAHWHDSNGRFVGALIYKAVFEGRDPFHYLDGFDAVTQADVCLPKKKINYWPNLDFAVLRAIRRAHPECLFVLNYRRPQAIAESIGKWVNLQTRIKDCDIPGLPSGIGGTSEQLVIWIENHFDACRSLFANDPQFLEIDIESQDAPEILGKALGVEISGWGDVKPRTWEAARKAKS